MAGQRKAISGRQVVAAGGYRWIVTKSGARVLQPRIAERLVEMIDRARKAPSNRVFIGTETPAPTPDIVFNHYDPMEKRGIFRKFAALDSRDAMLAFATEYGLLTGANSEPEAFWQQEIKALRSAIAESETLRSSQFQVEEARAQRLANATLNEVQTPQAYRAAFRDLEIAERRMHFAESLTERLDVRPALRAKPYPSSGFALAYAPRSLLSVLWLQLAHAITGDEEWRVCERDGCGEWFQVGAGTSRGALRADAKFHDERCRDAAKYQKRKHGRKGK